MDFKYRRCQLTIYPRIRSTERCYFKRKTKKSRREMEDLSFKKTRGVGNTDCFKCVAAEMSNDASWGLFSTRKSMFVLSPTKNVVVSSEVKLSIVEAAEPSARRGLIFNTNTMPPLHWISPALNAESVSGHVEGAVQLVQPPSRSGLQSGLKSCIERNRCR